MKKKELYTLLRGINAVKDSDIKGAKFSYGLIKNKKAIEKEIKILDEVRIPDGKYTEYDVKRIGLCKEYCKKDKEGKPIILRQAFDIEPATKPEFDEKIELLQNEYKQVIEDYKKQFEDFEKLLDEEANIKIHYIKIEEVPEALTAAQLEPIYELIKE